MLNQVKIYEGVRTKDYYMKRQLPSNKTLEKVEIIFSRWNRKVLGKEIHYSLLSPSGWFHDSILKHLKETVMLSRVYLLEPALISSSNMVWPPKYKGDMFSALLDSVPKGRHQKRSSFPSRHRYTSSFQKVSNFIWYKNW